jgi:hypothetical protein
MFCEPFLTTKLFGSAAKGFVITRKPDFFIVGAPKCGTTAMSQYLAGHPDIFVARKEMHHFGADLRFGEQFYRRGMDEYLAEFKAWGNQKRAGEASVWYLYSSKAAAEIKSFNPEARIIIMLRKPVEMLHSLYYSFLWDGNEHLPTFEEALAAQEERRVGRNITRQTYFAQGLMYREITRFTDQIKRYFDIFGRDRVHIIIYDDIAADTAAVYRRVLDFLEVDSTHVQKDLRAVNTNKFVKSPALRAMLSDPMVRSVVLGIRPFLPGAIFRGMQKVDARIRRLNTRVAGRPPLSLDLRQEMNRWFAPEIERLSALIGRDLSHWDGTLGPESKINSPPSSPNSSNNPENPGRKDSVEKPGGRNARASLKEADAVKVQS